MSDSSQKVAVIGIDGGTFRVIEPLLAQGRLPALARLIAKGTKAILRSSVQPSSEQAWPAFFTGVNNGKHGIYSFVRKRRGTYDFEFINRSSIQAEDLWSWVGRFGCESVIVNVPMTYPVRPLNGALVSGLMTPGVSSEYTYPPELRDRIRRHIPHYQIDLDIQAISLKDDAAIEPFVENIERMVRSRREVTELLLQDYSPSLLVVVFAETDRVSHKWWQRSAAASPESADPTARDILAETYESIDREIGRLIERLGEGWNYLVMSDHGFAALGKAFYLNKWLAKEGYVNFRASDKKASLAFSLARRLNSAAEKWRPLKLLKTSVLTHLPQIRDRLYSKKGYGKMDWAKTRAFAFGTMGDIYLNVAGREPEGIVQPGEEYESLRSEIIAKLDALVDDEGRKVFSAVYRKEEIYQGPTVEDAPDIIPLIGDGYYRIPIIDLHPHRDSVFTPAEDPAFLDEGTGAHSMDGIFIASGPDIRADRLPDSPDIVDLFPTICRLLNCPLPEHVDGRPLEEILRLETAEPLRAEQPAGAQTAQPPESEEAGEIYSEEEKKKLEEHLRGLGYID
ncbi:MAG: hypothetical protein GTO55_07275 [Armatimonadetes bacterium]|nr:hypothetical protein [Armatimonadota bacterium]NIM24072.1 hypothetical protein [Armatimonadota bacterium]NIM67926.1 hypothetical protein [Armatimonadota bacterium]NIM76448.1 hypothetical protein [Armatimonadota bacterium]NIN06156.1 hypothetical protein [Armatimonadota bacterium]